jgi:hypothetical protein
MRTITSFPERFTQINDQVAELFLKHYLSRDEVDPEDLAQYAEWGIQEEEYRICDIWITLKDGRVFGFQPATPEYLREYMERERELAFVSSGLLVISEMTEEAILNAIEQCFSQAPQFPLEHFGYRMSTGEDDDEDDPVE